MQGIGEALLGKLRRADICGGWLKSGFDYGRSNYLFALVERKLMRSDGQGDFVVTAEGRRLLTVKSHRRQNEFATG